MNKYLIILGLTLANYFAFGQSEMSAFTSTGRAGVATTFVTDYQAIAINPSNLGWGSELTTKKVSFGFLEMNTSLYSDAFSKDLFRNKLLKFNTEELTYGEQKDLALNFIDAGLYANIDIQLAGLSIYSKLLGGFGFNVREKIQWMSYFSDATSDILFLGRNSDYFDKDSVIGGDTVGIATNPKYLSELFDGSRISLKWIREYNFSYGKRLFNKDKIEIFGGLGFKYLEGYGILDIYSKGGEFIHSMVSYPPKLDGLFGEIGNNNFATIDSNKLKPVGKGFGMDFGASIVMNKKLKIGIALNNIGSITWKGNVYDVKDTLLTDLKSTGLSSYAIYLSMDDITSHEDLISLDGVEERKVSLPSIARLGASYKLNKMLEAGIDIIVPMNDASGNLRTPYYALGADFTPFKWFRLSTGISDGGNYAPSVPIGITFIIGKGSWETGFATRDVTTYFRDNRPGFSASFGFLRFRVGSTKAKESQISI